VLWSVTGPAGAQTEWIAALRGGGHVIVFRHGATHQDQADTDPFNLDNVAKQRQLTDAGRATAREIGEAFRKLRIPVGPVRVSTLVAKVQANEWAKLAQSAN
jgi:phosphohistidine phosphatase SixA